MADKEKVIKGLKEAEIMLAQAVDRGGEMAAMGAFKCFNHVSDALALLKEQDNCENCAIAIEDRQPVVRCKDCKMNNQCSIQFKFADADNPGDWFCAYGKRRDDDA